MNEPDRTTSDPVRQDARLTKLVRYETEPIHSEYWAEPKVCVSIEFQLDVYSGWTFGVGGECNWAISPTGDLNFQEGWSNWGAYWEHDPSVYFGVGEEHFNKIEGLVPNFIPSPMQQQYGEDYWYPPAKGLVQENFPHEVLRTKLGKTIDDFNF